MTTEAQTERCLKNIHSGVDVKCLFTCTQSSFLLNLFAHFPVYSLLGTLTVVTTVLLTFTL